MKPPKFWSNPPQNPGFMARALGPMGTLAARATARRVARQSEYQADVPVICVGNINLGGTGKTPTVIALVQHYAQLGIRAFVISRGYGGSVRAATEVDPARMSAAMVGDEPLLIAAFTRIWVCPDRVEAARLAQEAGAAVIIMDDGHQNPTLHKDFSIIVVDAEVGFGNGCVAPAGPLREPVETGLARADLVVIIGPRDAQAKVRQDWPALGTLPNKNAHLAPLEMGMDWQGHRVLAFAGIGRPAKFFATLRGLGAELVQTISLDDHQPLTNALLLRMRKEAELKGAQLVTTEKDAVRLPPSMRAEVLTLPVRLTFDDPDALAGLPRPPANRQG